MSGNVAVVFGTRPEMIKLAPVVARLGGRATLVHSGQHYDAAMSATFLDELGLGPPDHHLGVGAETWGAQVGRATVSIERLLLDESFDAVLVQGDTNSGLAGALAANAARTPLVHLEAGMRSDDRRMPEEHNRIVIDALADLCLAPHPANAGRLRDEGIGTDRILVGGSTLYEAVAAMTPSAERVRAILERFDLRPSGYLLATAHREENVDDPRRLESILGALGSFDCPVVLPLHPRSRRRVEEAGLARLLDRVRAVEPQGYSEFLALAANCALMISDSGGVQEEAAIIKRPVLVMRESTERPELVGSFVHLVGIGPAIVDVANDLLADIAGVHRRLAEIPYPYRTDAAGCCVDAIDERFGTR